MALNQPNPQRGTGVRKPGTGVRPNPAAAPAPAPQPGANRPTGTRRPGAPAAGGRPALRSGPPQKEGSGKVGKYLLLTIIVLLLGMVGYGFVPRGKDEKGNLKPGLFMALLKKYLPSSDAKPEGEDAGLPDLDKKYKRALDAREKAKAYLDEQQKFAEKPELLTEVEKARVVRELEKFREEVEAGTDDLGRVANAEGKGTAVDGATAKEEQKKQKAFALELGNALKRWRGAKEQIFAKAGEPEFIATKFGEKKPEEPKPEKRDPKRGESAVLPLDPSTTPKPPTEPEKPKEDPKPEPKPEPEKPKPEPEKPKPEPKPEPEKPKPAEPKPEPVKPKPEPEKPKEEPKPEPEKPKPAEPKPEPKPEKKADVLIAEADQLVLDGRPMVKEVLDATKNLPEDQEQLKTLSMKLETAQAFFIKARDTYLSAKDAAPAGADVPAKIGKIEKILELLQKTGDGIKSKLK